MGQEMGLSRILIDLRNCRNTDSEIHKYGFSYRYLQDERKIDRSAKVAIVVAENDPSHNFIEALEHNAGLRAVIFHEIKEAREYLKIHRKQSKQEDHLELEAK
jgi:hypothetical protein